MIVTPLERKALATLKTPRYVTQMMKRQRMSLLLTTSSRADTMQRTKRNWCTVARLLDPPPLRLYSFDVLDTWQSWIPRWPSRDLRRESCTDWWKCTWRLLLGYFVFGARALFRKRGDIIELQLTLAGRNNLYRSGCSLILYILRLPGRLKLSIRYRVFASLLFNNRAIA